MNREIIGNATLYLGDCEEILPALPKGDVVITDPPYGIGRAGGMGGGGGGLVKRARTARHYECASWDARRPSADAFRLVLAAAPKHIIWGGQYFADLLPASTKWLYWDKVQTMPSFSNGELAWTSLPGNALKAFVYNGSGLLAKEKDREHPTQKPIALMDWCLSFVPDAKVVIDPYMGSGSTGVSSMGLGRQFIGIERGPKYFDVACRRIEDAQRQRRLIA